MVRYLQSTKGITFLKDVNEARLSFMKLLTKPPNNKRTWYIIKRMKSIIYAFFILLKLLIIYNKLIHNSSTNDIIKIYLGWF